MNQLINKYLQSLDFYVNFTLNEEFNESIKSRYRDDFTYLGIGSIKEYKNDVKIKEGSSIRITFACEDNKISLDDN